MLCDLFISSIASLYQRSYSDLQYSHINNSYLVNICPIDAWDKIQLPPYPHRIILHYSIWIVTGSVLGYSPSVSIYRSPARILAETRIESALNILYSHIFSCPLGTRDESISRHDQPSFRLRPFVIIKTPNMWKSCLGSPLSWCLYLSASTQGDIDKAYAYLYDYSFFSEMSKFIFTIFLNLSN